MLLVNSTISLEWELMEPSIVVKSGKRRVRGTKSVKNVTSIVAKQKGAEK